MEISDIRRRFKLALEQAKKASAEKRERTDMASTAFAAFLRDTAVPVVRMFANVAKAEGQPFAVFTPPDTVRLASERNADDFIEIWLDTSLDPPQVATRVNRVRGRNLTSIEGLLRKDAPINGFTDEDVLAFLLEQIGALVER
jgi:hypothetical protein